MRHNPMKQNQTEQIMNLQVTEGLTVAVIQDKSHEFIMPTIDVATGYGVAEETILSHRKNHKEEIIEGTHFVRGGQISTTLFKNNQPNKIFWTKAGIIRLGMFIKSERAKSFRDWVEAIVLTVTAHSIELPKAKKRNHNRITGDRMIDLLADIALIEDKGLRMSIINKLMPERVINIQLPLAIEKGGQTI